VSARGRQLGRLLALRKSLERVREAEFARARGEAEATRGELRTLARVQEHSRVNAQERLSDGDREGWWVEQSAGVLIERAREELRNVLEEREASVDATRVEFDRCRVQREQARLLHEAVLLAERKDAERREQATSDDRFAARAHWMRNVSERS
jgi:flagellar export protein FliJ